ncbi:MAG: hypothetical protein LQ343_003398 [Gyalolechia ehrenbergii]|nr:MAG: hypothetical protein LQ343_003398 [Gyalolechia ehrenbergii]
MTDTTSAHSTSGHPPRNHPDATEAPQRRFSSSTPSRSSELADLKMRLHRSLRQYPDFPAPGVLFEDILPLFSDHLLHESLIRALELQVTDSYGQKQIPDVVVGLEARGFLFGPSLALALGAGFVPVRKQGKLPGPTETAAFEKEYGEDFFQIQSGAIKPDQRVIIVDDIIATGGSAAAAGSLIQRLGGTLIGYLFILELDFLKGRDKLDAPVHTLLSSQEKGTSKT